MRQMWIARFGGLALTVLLLTMLLPACGDDESTDDGGGTGPGVTGASIEGIVLEFGREMRLPGVEVTLQPRLASAGAGKESPAILAATRTDGRGRFVLDGLDAGEYLLVIDGGTTDVYEDPSLTATFLPMGIELGENEQLRLPDPIRLASWNREEGVFYSGTGEVNLTALGLGLTFGEGNVSYPVQARDMLLGLLRIPAEATNAPLPDGIFPNRIYMLEPAGTLFDMPVDMAFDNSDAWPFGTEVEVYGLDHVANEYVPMGTVVAEEDGHLRPETPFLTRATQFFLAPPAYTVTGRFVHDTEGPFVGAQVEIVSVDGFMGWYPPVVASLSSVTDANGDFSIADVRVTRPGIRMVYSGEDGTYEFLDMVNPADPDLGTIQLAMPTMMTVTIEGVVQDLQGNPAADAQVQLVLSDDDLKASKVDIRPDALYTVRSGADGSYRIEDAVLRPDEHYELWAGNIDDVYTLGWRDFWTPLMEDTGTTLTFDLYICEYDYGCGQSQTWSLEENVLTITDAFNVCYGGTEEPYQHVYDVLALSGGTLVMEDQEGGEDLIFERVGGTGPDGISVANAPGIYRIREDAALKDSGSYYVLCLPDGSMRRYPSDASESGLYTATGSTMTVTAMWPEEEDPRELGFVRDGDRLAIYEGPTLIYSLERCPLDTETGLDGLWTGDDPSGGETIAVVLYEGEYAFMKGFFMLFR